MVANLEKISLRISAVVMVLYQNWVLGVFWYAEAFDSTPVVMTLLDKEIC